MLPSPFSLRLFGLVLLSSSWGNERPFHVTNGKLSGALAIICEPAGWADDDSGRLRVGSCMSRLCLGGATRPDGVKWIRFHCCAPSVSSSMQADTALIRKPQFGRLGGQSQRRSSSESATGLTGEPIRLPEYCSFSLPDGARLGPKGAVLRGSTW